jgi:hypothetical protein
MDINKIISIVRILKEEPNMNLGAGEIAGTEQSGDDPPVYKKGSKKYIYGGRNSRKLWMQNLKEK